MRSKKCPVRAALSLLIGMLSTAVVVLGQESAREKQQEDGLARLQARGKASALTILAPRLINRPSPEVGEVIGMTLERSGMTELELGIVEFRQVDQADFAATGNALTAFIRANPPKTDYVLYAEFLGSPATGAEEIRGFIADKSGALLWQDRQTLADAALKAARPKEPLTCVLFLVQRLKPILSFDDPSTEDRVIGKLARRWQERTGLPTGAEKAAMQERREALGTAAASARLLVLPPRAGAEVNKEAGSALAMLINDAGLMKATSRDMDPGIARSAGMNEQKILWGMARGLSAFVTAHPQEEDYVLYADYLLTKEGVGAVHFAIADSKGRLVVVDFQNDHHDDFIAVAPKSVEDCHRLLLRRLERYCR